MPEPGLRIMRQLLVRTVLATLLAGILAALFTLRLDNEYRARALLILAPMPFSQKDEVPGNVAGFDEPTRRVNYIKVGMMEALAMPDYDLVLTSEEIAGKLRDGLRKGYEDRKISPGKLSIENVKRGLDVRSKMIMQTVEKVQYQQIVELYLTAKDPQVAADVANQWADISIETAKRMRTTPREGAVEFIQGQLDETWRNFNEAKAGVEKIEREINPDALAERVAQMESAVTQNDLKQAELQADAARFEAQMTSLTGAQDQQRAAAQSDLAGARAEAKALADEQGPMKERLTGLRGDLARVKNQMSSAELQIKAYTKHIEELGVSLEATKMAAADLTPEFKIAARALPPEEKTAPHRTLIVLVVMFLAAVAAPVHLFGMHALRRYARTLDEA